MENKSLKIKDSAIFSLNLDTSMDYVVTRWGSMFSKHPQWSLFSNYNMHYPSARAFHPDLWIVSPPGGEWADLAGTAIASQPVRWAEQAPNCISGSKNQGDNRRRM